MKIKFLFLSFFLIGLSSEAKQTLKKDSIKKLSKSLETPITKKLQETRKVD